MNREILNWSSDDSLLQDRKDTGNPWSMSKDGKHYFDPRELPELMRK